MRFSRDIKGGVSVSWRMIILLCGRDQCGLNEHPVDPDSMRIESWSSVDRPLYCCASPPMPCTSEVITQKKQLIWKPRSVTLHHEIEHSSVVSDVGNH